MPSELACKIEQRFAESQLIGPRRRLGEVVDDVLNDAAATGYCADQLRADGRPDLAHLLQGLMRIAANKSDDPVLSNIEQGVRDGLASSATKQA